MFCYFPSATAHPRLAGQTHVLNTLLQDGEEEGSIATSTPTTGHSTLSRRRLVLWRLLAILLRRKSTGTWLLVIRLMLIAAVLTSLSLLTLSLTLLLAVSTLTGLLTVLA
jgi:hypothetical protein